MKRPVVLYHADCLDGITAAWVVGKYFDNCEFVAVNYHDPVLDVTDRTVFVVDFSYKYDGIIKMANEAEHVYIFDHHESFKEELERIKNEELPLPTNLTIAFNQSKCGATLTLQSIDHIFGKPKYDSDFRFLKYIEDQDLWTHCYKDTKPFIAGLLSVGALSMKREDAFKIFDDMTNETIEHYINIGNIVVKERESTIKQIVATGVRRVDFAGYNVPVVNCPHSYSSEIGNLLSENEPFAICYVDQKDGRRFSLRSWYPKKEKAVDVAAVCKSMGGGGHQAAAGFFLPYDNLLFDRIFKRWQ